MFFSKKKAKKELKKQKLKKKKEKKSLKKNTDSLQLLFKKKTPYKQKELSKLKKLKGIYWVSHLTFFFFNQCLLREW